MLGLDLFEDDLCNGCGLPTLVRTDPSNLFRIHHDVCPTCKSLAQYGRVQADADQKAKAANKETPSTPLPSDGRTTHLRRVGAAEAESDAGQSAVATP